MQDEVSGEWIYGWKKSKTDCDRKNVLPVLDIPAASFLSTDVDVPKGKRFWRDDTLLAI